jgi:hypothetical protein
MVSRDPSVSNLILFGGLLLKILNYCFDEATAWPDWIDGGQDSQEGDEKTEQHLRVIAKWLICEKNINSIFEASLENLNNNLPTLFLIHLLSKS